MYSSFFNFIRTLKAVNKGEWMGGAKHKKMSSTISFSHLCSYLILSWKSGFDRIFCKTQTLTHVFLKNLVHTTSVYILPKIKLDQNWRVHLGQKEEGLMWLLILVALEHWRKLTHLQLPHKTVPSNLKDYACQRDQMRAN